MSEPASSARSGQKILIIYNPLAGGARAGLLRGAVEMLTTRAVVEVYAATSPQDAQDRARAAGGDPSYAVVAAAGGDGTVRDVVSGVMAAPGAGIGPQVGVLPLGTTNVLARELGLPRRIEEAARILVDGAPREVRFGTVNDRVFLTMVGVGFDATVLQNVNLRLKSAFGRGAYVVEAARCFAHLRPLTYAVEVDQGQVFAAASVVVARARFYGGNFTCAPLASLNDPTLHVCLFTRPGRLHALRYMVALGTHRLAALPDYKVVVAANTVITGPPDAPVQADGDIVGALPARVAVADRAVAILTGSASGETPQAHDGSVPGFATGL